MLMKRKRQRVYKSFVGGVGTVGDKWVQNRLKEKKQRTVAELEELVE